VSARNSDLELFRSRIRDEWLPPYLADYGYEPGGYFGDVGNLTEIDALWFMRAIDEGVVTLLPKARLLLPASPIKATIFWEHSKAVSPRPISLHREGILSTGMAARLHFEFGWPVPQLGFEYPFERGDGRRAFDIGALTDDGKLLLAGEAKNARDELAHLLAVMNDCGMRGAHAHEPPEKNRTNGHRKWLGLIRCQPEVFFTFGPGEDWSTFRVSYDAGVRSTMTDGDKELLYFRP
jgi:hypothetical protein